MLGPDLEHQTSPEVGQSALESTQPVLLVPLGATEQHGPHLPLSTDTVIAEAWARAVADELSLVGVTALVAPPLPYGSSGEHQAFAGTLSIGAEALKHVLIELARSARYSFRAVVFLSGHGGNAEPVDAAVAQLRHEGHEARHRLPQWPSRPEVDAHAGFAETSILLHLRPSLVRRDRLEPGDRRPLSTVLDQLRRGGVISVSSNGILGDPSGASEADGAVLFDDLVRRTVAELAGLADLDDAGDVGDAGNVDDAGDAAKTKDD